MSELSEDQAKNLARILGQWVKDPPPEVVQRIAKRLAVRRLGMPRGCPSGVLSWRMGF